jgi:DNA repair exonuclease SbcCD ATPase subunit
VSAAFDAAQTTLFQAALGDFVAERKRLAAELKAAGDKESAARLAKIARPSVSAWTVNQLWWNERDAFEALLEAAQQVKSGNREASKQHREALTELRERATALLEQAGNAASETTLRRIATTLSALAASGGFDPDPPGALVADRDPPGFETFVASAAPRPAQAPPDAASKKEEAAAQRRAEEEERKRRAAERERLSAALKDAKHIKSTQQREVARLKAELETAEQNLEETEALLAEIDEQLTNL